MNQPVSWARRITFWLHRIKVKSALKMRGKPMTRKKDQFVCRLQSQSVPRTVPSIEDQYTTQDQGSGCNQNERFVVLRRRSLTL